LNIILNNRFKKAFVYSTGFFSLFFLTLLSSCKEKTILNPDLIPPVDNINTFEINDWNMEVRIKYRDSLYTSDITYPVGILGRISKDDFFGSTNAGIYLQVIPPSANFTFPTTTIMDSSVLVLPYYGLSFGDTIASNSPTIRVYRIEDNFVKDTEEGRKYYSFDKLNYNTSPIGEGVLILKDLQDSLRQFRIKLNHSFSELIAHTDSAHFATDTAFLNYFNGVYISPDTTQDNVHFLSYFRLDNAGGILNDARIEFHYRPHPDSVSRKATFQYSTLSSAFFSSITRNYSGFPAQNYMNDHQTLRDSVIVQGAPGFQSEITIKLDKNIPPSVINKAALTFTLINLDRDEKIAPADQLIVNGVNENGEEYYLADRLNKGGTLSNDGLSFVDAKPRSVMINGVKYIQYTINIPREVTKAYLEGKSEIKLRIRATTDLPGAFRFIAPGPNGPEDLKLKFNLIYSKLN
jgi:hypothetical protein